MTQIDFNSKIRKSLDLVIAILIGVLTSIYWDWKWLLIIVGIYSFLKANYLISILRKTSSALIMSEPTHNDIYSIQNKINQENRIKGYEVGYLVSQWFIQLFLTFAIVGVLSSIIKLTFGWAMSSTLWLTLCIIFWIFTIYMTIKRTWES